VLKNVPLKVAVRELEADLSTAKANQRELDHNLLLARSKEAQLRDESQSIALGEKGLESLVRTQAHTHRTS
jgi:multidrug resistance efflux pump